MLKRAALAVICLIFFGWIPSAAAYKGSATIALPDDPLSMDPHITSSTIGWMIWRWPYDTLLSSDPKTGKISPWLAERWEKLGPKQYKFFLRRGVKFADGTPFTTAAIKYSMERILDPELKGRQLAYWKDFDRFEIIDDYTLILHLKSPDNGFLRRISERLLIMSPKVKEGPSTAPARQTFGSGPYVLKSWTKSIRMVFEANPTWWANSLYPDRPKTVVVRTIKESTTRVKALLVGEVDVIMRVGAQEVPEIERNAQTKVGVVPGLRIFYLSFANRFGGPFSDEKIRLAANYAMDADSIIKTIVGGLGTPIGQLYHPWAYSGHNPARKWHGYDLAKAKALMKESSHPNGFKATLITTTGTYPFDKPTAEAVAGMLKKIGIETSVQAVPFPMFRKLFTAYQTDKKDPAMFFRGWGQTMDSAYVWRGTSSCTGIWSVSCYQDLDAWNEKAAAIDDVTEQQAAFEKMTGMMKEKAVHKIFFQMVDAWGYRKNLGLDPRPDENLYPWEIRLK